MDGQNSENTNNNSFPEFIDLESEASDANYQTDSIPEIVDLESEVSVVCETVDPSVVSPSDEEVDSGNYFTNLLNEDGLLSPTGASSGVDQRLEESHFLNLNLFTGQTSDILSPMHGASFGNPNSIIDLNADAYEGNDNDVNQEIGSGSNSSSFLANRPYGHHNAGAPPRDGTSPYLLEQNDNGEGTSDGRRKRRAPEGVSRQLRIGESSRSGPRVGSSEEDALADESTSIGNRQDANYSEELPAGPEVGDEAADTFKHRPSSAGIETEEPGAGSRTSFDLNVTVAQEENFERNTRFRSSTDQHDLMPANQENNLTAANPQEQSVASPPTVLFPFDPVPNHILRFLSNSPPTQSLVRVHYSQTLQLQSGQLPNGVTAFRSPAPRAPTFTMNGESAFPTGHIGTSLNSMVIHQPSAPAEDTLVNIEEEFERIMSPTESHPGLGTGEYARRLSVIVNQTDVYHEAARLEVDPFRSRSAVPAPEDNNPRTFPGGPMLQLAAVQGRNRMMFQIRNALAFLRSGGTMTFEELITIGRPVLNGVPEEQPLDVHENMQLDVDNMSYEELLELEDQIGYVETGLNENVVDDHLASATYRSTDPSMEDETCCICQEEYANEEHLGRLNCRHYYHYDCIKRWLMEKNVCAICKGKALDI